MLNHDLLMVADAVAREKNIEREDVILAMEHALQKAAASKYGFEKDLRADVDRRTGNVSLWQYTAVVEIVEDNNKEMTLDDARRHDHNLQIGDFYKQELPPIEFGRIAAQSAKQIIVQRVREAERVRQYDEFKDRVGEIISGTVKRIEYGNITVDLGKGEGIVRREEVIPRESFHHGDRIRAYIYDVRQEPRGPQIFLSRTHPQFMAKLFAQEVPEIYEGNITIVNVARDPGSRAKMSVTTKDQTIDPVGACVGMRGSRVRAIVNELQGEKVDIIHWTDDSVNNIVAAMTPCNVSKVVLAETGEKVEVVVPDDQLSLAIGRRGQNVRLASILTGWDIDVMTATQEADKRKAEFSEISQTFQEALGVDDFLAHILINEGFRSVEELTIIDVSELENIEGFDSELAQELYNRAKEYFDTLNESFAQKIDEYKIDNSLQEFVGLTSAMLVKLGEHHIRTLEDFADLSSDELIDGEESILFGFDLSREHADNLIIEARIKAGWIKEEPQAQISTDGEENVENENKQA